MGAADMVPGVSGGTIALITGIYERLVTAIAALDPRVLGELVDIRTSAARERSYELLLEMDVPFLLALGFGIATAVLATSRVIEVAFTSFPAVMSAFFFCLMAASAVVIYRDVDLETIGQRTAGLGAIVIAFTVSGATSGGTAGSLPMIFVAGAVAISAMVLPGISGAAFLYILGQYEFLLGALNEFVGAAFALPSGGSTDALVETGPLLVAFMTGAVLGLVTIARLVKWALERYRVALMAFLIGLMVGALRLPVERALAETAQWTPGLIAGIVLAGALGGGVVLLLEQYTDSLEYT